MARYVRIATPLSPTSRHRHGVGWLIVAGIAITVILRDWNLLAWSGQAMLNRVLYVVPITPALVMLAEKALTRRRSSVAGSRAGQVYLLLVSCFVLAIVFSRVAGNWLTTGGQTYMYVLLVQMVATAYAGFAYATSPREAAWLLERIAWLTAILSTLSVGLLLVGRYTGESFWGQGSASSVVFGAPNWGVQAFLVFGICWFGVQLLTIRRPGRSAAIGLALCAYDFVALAKPTVFSLVGAFCVALVLLFVVSRPTRSLAARRGTATVALGLATSVGLNLVTSGKLLRYAADRYLHLAAADSNAETAAGILNAAATGRTTRIWPQVWERFAESPWIGGGFGQTFVVDSSGLAYSTHSGYLELLVGAGIIGILPVVIGHLWWLARVLPSLRDRRIALIQVALISYVVGVMVNLAGDVTAYYWSPMLMYALALGISMRLAVGARRESKAQLEARSTVPTLTPLPPTATASQQVDGPRARER